MEGGYCNMTPNFFIAFIGAWCGVVLSYTAFSSRIRIEQPIPAWSTIILAGVLMSFIALGACGGIPL